MRIELGEAEQTEIGFAPLIDCIFLLLIFFLVATSFKKDDEKKNSEELPIDLPISSASFDWQKAEAPPLVIGVDRQGNYYWGTKEVSVTMLREHLQKAKEDTPSRRIRIDGDKMTSYQNIIHVLDLCQFEGFTNIGVHTRN